MFLYRSPKTCNVRSALKKLEQPARELTNYNNMLFVKQKREPEKYKGFSDELNSQVDALNQFQVALCCWTCEVDELKPDEPDDALMLQLTADGNRYTLAAEAHLNGARGAVTKFKGVLEISGKK